MRREIVDGTEFAVVVEVEAERRDAADVAARRWRGRLISGLQIPRGMRWGARPAGERLPALLASHPLARVQARRRRPCEVPFYGLHVGDVSQGHRVLGAPIIIDEADHYERHLAEQKVVVDQDERRRASSRASTPRAAALGGDWSDPGDVLAEAVYLAEWPSVPRGGFAARHLRLPDDGARDRHAEPPALLPGARRATAACCRRSSTSPTPTRRRPS